MLKNILLKNYPKTANRIKRLLGRDSYFRIQLEDWLSSLDIKATKVLDIGGLGRSVKGRTRTWKVQDYRILDNGLQGSGKPDYPIDVNRLSSEGKKRWLYGGKANKILSDVVKYSPRIIFCLEVMEYIFNPLAAVSFMHDILAEGGILYISFPSIYPVHEPELFDYLRYTRQGIIRLLKEAGFTNWQIIARKAAAGKSALGEFYAKEKMKGLMNNDVVFDTGYLVAAHK